jgi:hypothetical protein
MKKLFFTLIVLITMAIPVSAAININVDQRSDSFIKWGWTPGLNTTALSIDGYQVNQFDHNSNTFILSGLPANETHSIAIYTSDGDSGVNVTETLPAKDNMFFGLPIAWAYVLLIVILYLLAATIHWSVFFVGIAIGLYEIYDYIQKNGSSIAADAAHLQLWIMVGLVLLGLLLWILKMKGGRRR